MKSLKFGVLPLKSVLCNLWVLTGYLLQVASDPAWLSALVWAHVSTSLLFVVGYGAHLVIGWRLSGHSAPLARAVHLQ